MGCGWVVRKFLILCVVMWCYSAWSFSGPGKVGAGNYSMEEERQCNQYFHSLIFSHFPMGGVLLGYPGLKRGECASTVFQSKFLWPAPQASWDGEIINSQLIHVFESFFLNFGLSFETNVPFCNFKCFDPLFDKTK